MGHHDQVRICRINAGRCPRSTYLCSSRKKRWERRPWAKVLRGFTTGADCKADRAASNSSPQVSRDLASSVLHEAEINTVNTRSSQCLRGECVGCRFDLLPQTVNLEPADHRTWSPNYSSWIRHPVLLSRNIYDCWRPRLDCLHTLFVFATFDIRLPRAHHSKKMSRRVCVDGVDKTEIWHSDSSVFECFDVSRGHS